MKLKNHPPASAKGMFTAIEPHVKAMHKIYRSTLDDLVRKENAQHAAADSTRPNSQDDSTS